VREAGEQGEEVQICDADQYEARQLD